MVSSASINCLVAFSLFSAITWKLSKGKTSDSIINSNLFIIIFLSYFFCFYISASVEKCKAVVLKMLKVKLKKVSWRENWLYNYY